MTKDRQAAKKLYEQTKEYHLMDAKSKVNFRARLRRLAKKINPRLEGLDNDTVATIMYLDIVSARTGITITYKEA